MPARIKFSSIYNTTRTQTTEGRNNKNATFPQIFGFLCQCVLIQTILENKQEFDFKSYTLSDHMIYFFQNLKKFPKLKKNFLQI